MCWMAPITTLDKIEYEWVNEEKQEWVEFGIDPIAHEVVERNTHRYKAE